MCLFMKQQTASHWSGLILVVNDTNMVVNNTNMEGQRHLWANSCHCSYSLDSKCSDIKASRWSKGGPKGGPPGVTSVSKSNSSTTTMPHQTAPKTSSYKTACSLRGAGCAGSLHSPLYTVQRPTPKRKPWWSGALLYKGRCCDWLWATTNEKGRAVIGCELQLINDKGHAVIGSERQLTNEKGRAVIGSEWQLTNEKDALWLAVSDN